MVPQSEAMAELLENTEDAYGFPPYRYLAEALTVGGSTYEELREQERLILVSAMESVRIHRLGSDDFDWADRIAAELGEAAVPKDEPFIHRSNTASNSQDVFVTDHRNVSEVDPPAGL